ncbi:MAG: hypothetical protein WC822_04970 [Candidatus Paceibacterota bacterium]|jgi:hypothetical protein
MNENSEVNQMEDWEKIRRSVELPEKQDIVNMLSFTDKVAELSYKAGIKAVSDFLKPKGTIGHRFDGGTWIEFAVDSYEWQAFLKEWGIK